MRVLITGGAGPLARHLIERLQHQHLQQQREPPAVDESASVAAQESQQQQQEGPVHDEDVEVVESITLVDRRPIFGRPNKK